MSKIIKIQDILHLDQFIPRRFKLEDFIGKNIIITKFIPKKDKNSKKLGYQLHIKMKDGNDIIVFTCAINVVNILSAIQLKTAELNLKYDAFVCKVDKEGNYLTLKEFKNQQTNDNKRNESEKNISISHVLDQSRYQKTQLSR